MAQRMSPVILRAGAASLLLILCLFTATAARAAIIPQTIYGTGGMTGAAGEVLHPEGITVDPITGRVALADYDNYRVSVFAPDGTFLLAFGKDVNPGGGTGPEVCTSVCKAGVDGSEAGALDTPYEAEFSPSGKEIFVADNSNKRISVFSSEGVFRRAFGKDVDPGGGPGPEICTTTCQAGDDDGTGGSFKNFPAISFGPDGLAYVADAGVQRVDVYKPSGTWLRTFGQDVDTGGGTGFEVCSVAADCQPGAAAGSDGALAFPDGLDFDPDGRLWVAAGDVAQVRLFGLDPLAPLGAFGKDVEPGGGSGFEVCTDTCQAGVSGDGPGELDDPTGVGSGADGLTYVASAGNNRVNVYRDNLTFAFAFGADVVPGGGVGFEICRTDCKDGLTNEATGFDYPYGVAVDCRGIAYVTNAGGDLVPARAYGKPGVEPAPCRLKAGGAKLNKHKGTAKLTATVPYPSQLTLKGKGLKKANGQHGGLLGDEKLAVNPTGKLARKLERTGRAKVRAKLTMTPTDGNVTQTITAKLKLRRK